MNFYALVLSLFLMISCDKDETKMDQNSSTFTCTVAGKAFKASFAGARIEDAISDGTLQLFAIDEKAEISIELLLDEKTALTGKTVDAEGGLAYTASGKTYVITPDRKAKVNISLRSGDVVKGSFSFTADEDLLNPGKSTISVSDGKFELKIEK